MPLITPNLLADPAQFEARMSPYLVSRGSNGQAFYDIFAKAQDLVTAVKMSDLPRAAFLDRLAAIWDGTHLMREPR